MNTLGQSNAEEKSCHVIRSIIARKKSDWKWVSADGACGQIYAACREYSKNCMGDRRGNAIDQAALCLSSVTRFMPTCVRACTSPRLSGAPAAE